ncbi:WD repeat-containing protein 70 [Hondaea fermentalgiana]|uniref:WD repeat-containing protein 70 n=1 Tax=Hondaea fermentalgiana TaxID=2315210 RepID=A0A2R5GGG8_9STRA|nr:WD repeat-containing protein 70 [Hondaea fermentalgiana]|eukprot:GBG28848.1 WD repeat-containing protein 70 [Hondaea fermentalgiana]
MEIAAAVASNASGLWSGAALEVRKEGKDKVRDVLRVGELAKTVVVVGRKRKHCDIVVDHGSVSRAHAALIPVYTLAGEAELVVVDLGSSQGTFVNDEKLEPSVPVPLRTKTDVLRFGTSTRRYQLREAGVTKDVSTSKKQSAQAEVARNETELSRADRDAEIARLALEMSTTAPTYSLTPATSSLPPDNPGDKKVENEDDDQDEDDEGPRPVQAPASVFEDVPRAEQIRISAHTKSVSAIAIDKAGSRFVTGGNDCKVACFDFGGMNKANKAFREFQPVEDQIVRALSFNPSGNTFLVVLADSVALVYNRDCVELARTTKGDPYLMDMAKTKGHPSMITDGAWSPISKTQFLTSGIDGTLRLWDLERSQRTMMDNFLMSQRIIKAKSARATRVAVHSCAWTPGGDRIIAGCSDGSLQVWNVRPNATYIRPDVTIRDAHLADNEITSVSYSPDGTQLASRSQDGTLKVWDATPLRGTYKSVFTSSDRLENNRSQTGVVFSPDGRFVATAESGFGDLVVFRLDSKSAPPLRLRLAEQGSKPVAVEWHGKLNQIFVGCTDGSTYVLFDREKSSKGAILSSSREASKKREFFASTEPNKIRQEDIILPNALPMFRKDRVKKKARTDVGAATVQAAPQGQPSSSSSSSSSSFLSSSTPHPAKESGSTETSSTTGDNDIRAQLFAHRDNDKDSSKRVVLADRTMEADEEELSAKRR